MKKTLIALAVTAVATTASAGIKVYEQDGTSFSFDGRVHVRAEKTSTKTPAGKTEASALRNDGSRFAFDAKHNISNDAYALGRVEVRFDSGAAGRDGWGDAYAKRAFVGLGHKEAGQVTFGKQLLIGDGIGRIGLDNAYGVGSGLARAGGWAVLNEAADSSVRYDYTAVKGFTFSADYEFATERNTGKAEKNGYSVGAIYEFAAGEGTASVSLGYAHKDFETSAAKTTTERYRVDAAGRHVKDDFGNYIVDAAGQPIVTPASRLEDQNGVYGGFNYVVNGVKFGIDGGHSVKSYNNNTKDKLNFVRTGLRYDVDATGVYGNYGYLTVNLANGNKNKAHRVMLGADYKFHKNAKVYLEGRVDKTTLAGGAKFTDTAVGTGLIVFW